MTKVVHSSTLGLMPCEIVGVNESNYLVRVYGMAQPLNVGRAQVFDLAEGLTLEGGRLIGSPQAGSDPPDVREVQTAGGSVTIEAGEVVSAYCSRCNRSGLPIARGGGWMCICGAVIAKAGDLPEEVCRDGFS